MRYSPLCDSNLFAYFAYLASCVANGSNVECTVCQSGGNCVDESCRSSDDFAGHVVGIYRGFLEESRRAHFQVDSAVALSGIRGDICGVLDSGSRRGPESDACLASRDDGGCERGVDCNVGDEFHGRRAGGTECFQKGGEWPAGQSVHSVAPVVITRTELNRQKRSKAKLRRARKKEQVSSVPLEEGSGSGGVPVRGFFAAEPKEVQADLVSSRASMLIAENKLREVKAIAQAERIAASGSDVARSVSMLRELNGVIRSSKVVKEFGNADMSNWADMVVESVAGSGVSRASGKTKTSVSMDGQKHVYGPFKARDSDFRAEGEAEDRNIPKRESKPVKPKREPNIGDSGMYVARRVGESAQSHFERAQEEKKKREKAALEEKARAARIAIDEEEKRVRRLEKVEMDKTISDFFNKCNAAVARRADGKKD